MGFKSTNDGINVALHFPGIIQEPAPIDQEGCFPRGLEGAEHPCDFSILPSCIQNLERVNGSSEFRDPHTRAKLGHYGAIEFFFSGELI